MTPSTECIDQRLEPGEGKLLAPMRARVEISPNSAKLGLMSPDQRSAARFQPWTVPVANGNEQGA
jgi:hypothetical protein